MGEGQNGRTWITESKANLTFSFLLKPSCDIKKLDSLTIMTANTIIDVIDKLYGIKLSIKYPNDLILNQKKICGILTESTTKGNICTDIVIGIGLNINQIDFPEELMGTATSLKKEFPEGNFDKLEILGNFLNEFEKKFMELV